MLKPEKMSVKQGWCALKEARKGNAISQAIYRKWADCHAMPHDSDPECDTLKTYEDFTRHHVKVWYFE
jgi:hypothetical protein